MEDLTPGSTESAKKSAYEAQVGANYRCGRLSDYWLDSMDWISKNLGQNDRVISWWDYGHWINYFGERKTVLRNEHLSTGMIGRVAHDFLIGSTQDLIDSMNYFDSQYALFDAEIIGGTGGQPFGNKYGALNYLGCSHEGETGVQNSPGSSQCEIDHSPERFAVYQSPPQSAVCVISESQQRSGILAYTYTFSPTGGIILQSPLYCIGDATLATGEKIYGTYYVDRKDSDGNLVLNKGTIRPIQKATDAADPATQYVIAEMVYNNSKVWLGENGTVVDGMSDAKTDFYRSNLYKGFFLNDLPGFDLVYTSKNGDVKIFKMKDSVFTGNKQGIVNETAAAMTQ
jgi:asparagine N-glycosylation enzyme membrane subunit Stt3